METEEIIELPFASFLSRLAAFLIDYFLIVLIMSLLIAIVSPAGFAIEGPDVVEYNEEYVRDLSEALGPFMYLFYVVWWLYNALMHSGKWQATIGKRAMGIIVTDLDGERIGFGKASLRFLGKLVSSFLFFIPFLTAAFTSRRQAVHDMTAGTIVLEYRIPR